MNTKKSIHLHLKFIATQSAIFVIQKLILSIFCLILNPIEVAWVISDEKNPQYIEIKETFSKPESISNDIYHKVGVIFVTAASRNGRRMGSNNNKRNSMRERDKNNR